MQENFEPYQYHTQNLINPLMDKYHRDLTPRPRMVAGSKLSLLDDTMQAVRHKWESEFGRHLPDMFACQGYTMTAFERCEVYAIGLDILRTKRAESRMYSENVDVGYLTVEAARIKRSIFARAFDYTKTQPNLALQEPVLQVAAVQNATNKRYGEQADSTDCMVGVFGMTALKHAGLKFNDSNTFNTGLAAMQVRIHPNAPKGAIFDLPWLMGALTTPYAERALNMTSRVVVSVGADFGELERRVIGPLRAKEPKVDISLNVVLASPNNVKANHAVAILAADNNNIFVRDPKYKDPVALEPAVFWKDWASTNMQAVMVVSKPRY